MAADVMESMGRSMVRNVTAAAEGEAAAPGSRRRLSPAERLPQIHEAAYQEFAAAGYERASMQAVARRAGVTKGLLYHYFPDGKAALFRAVMIGCMQPVFRDAEAMLESFTGPRRELLRGMLDIAYACLAGDARERVLMRMMIAEGDRFPELADLYHAEVVARGDALARAILKSGVESGEFHPAALDWPPELLIGPVSQASTHLLLFGDRYPLDLEAQKRAHYQMLAEGLLRR